MAMDALPSNDFLNFLIYDTLSAAPICSSSFHQFGSSSFDTANTLAYVGQVDNDPKFPPQANNIDVAATHGGGNNNGGKKSNLGVVQGVGGKKKRRKRARVCKNKIEADTQRMTHIVVERNRRKQMNEHLSVLRSLMPQSYAQRGDQASIVGGAIEFVKELEHIVQSLEVQKFKLLTQQEETSHYQGLSDTNTTPMTPTTPASCPFSQFFTYPQYIRSQSPANDQYTASTKAAVADIEVTLIETHANIRILTKRNLKQPNRIVYSLQAAHLTILHLNITTMDSLVFYSISAKVEEGCPLNSVDDIAGAVHHMLRIIEQDEQKEDVDVAMAVASMSVP